MTHPLNPCGCFSFGPWLAWLAVIVGLVGVAPPARADEPGASFRSILAQQEKESLRIVSAYVTKNPQAADVEEACLWVFEAAVDHGLEADAVPVAEMYLRRRNLDPAGKQLAHSTLATGLARSGKLPEAMREFEKFMMGARLQSPFRALDLASGLAAQARIAGQLESSREMLQRVASAYPLDAQISEIVAARLGRQELIGKRLPLPSGLDTRGKPLDAADCKGKVVLIDFWSTTCAPCLAEFPNLKQLYADHHARGFEIVGVSFDDRAPTVEAFRERSKLPWRSMLNESPQGTVSERFRTKSIPALFVVDREGTIAQVDVRGPDLRLVIERLLK